MVYGLVLLRVYCVSFGVYDRSHPKGENVMKKVFEFCVFNKKFT